MKKCSSCKDDKHLSEFHVNPTKKDNLSTMCKKCSSEYSKQYYIKNRQKYYAHNKSRADRNVEFVQRVKRNSKCSKCDESRWYVLDFHHLRDKKYNIADASTSGYSINTIKDEIRKCIVLCANCHRELHYLENLTLKH